MSTIQGISKKALLIVLDGFGINDNDVKNAIKDAKTPHIDELFAHYPFTLIEAGGVSVGLPKGVPGNSEVGHMNLGAGKPVRQDLVRINEAIENGSFSQLDKIQELISKAKENSKRIHVMGLLSDGGVHSHINHIKEVFKTFEPHCELNCFFHAFMDGRDTAKNIGGKYLEELKTVPNLTIASIGGRSIGMDRDRRWEKIEHHYKTFTGQGKISDQDPLDYLKSEYEQERFDEFIEPALFNADSAMKEGDCVFFINFRPDRAIQMTLAMNDPEFKEFKRDFIPAHFLCMTPYVPDELDLPILFDKERVPGGLSEYLSEQGYSQLKIAETEKYAHVTFFFNGGEKKPFPKEEQVLIPSPKEVATYDEKPEMSAPLVTEKLLKALEEDYSFYLVNFANSDMVGHTGNYEAALKAVETLDDSVEQLRKKCEELGIAMMITADHGNSDQMVYPDGSPHTSHTGAPVPFCLFHPSLKDQKVELNEGHHALKDVAPTVLKILDIPFPKTFEGQNIFK